MNNYLEIYGADLEDNSPITFTADDVFVGHLSFVIDCVPAIGHISDVSLPLPMQTSKPIVGDKIWLFNTDRRDKANDRYGEVVRIGRKFFYIKTGIHSEERFEIDTFKHDNGEYSPYYKLYPSQEACEYSQKATENRQAISNHLWKFLTDEEAIKLYDTLTERGCPAYYPRMLLKVLFFAYLNNVYSCRKIARLLQENILYMWLSGKSTPDFRTINDFRSKRLKSCIHSLFTQIVLMLVELGYISLEKQYIDGTKMESAANRYTFVWRKSVEKYKERLEKKIQCILSQIDEGILGDNNAAEESTLPIDSRTLKEKIDAINLENRNKRELRQIKKLNEEYLPKLQEYEKHLETMGEKNSYSKTDPDATFMRMKEDHMRNGQLKPGYNLQISTENQFITNYAFYHNPGDTLTLISFLLYGRMRYFRFMKEVCADAGYGSEENDEFMERFGISAYVKYNYFHMEQTKKWKRDISKQDNLYYNEPEDYFVCPMGQHMELAYRTRAVNDNGYESEISVYHTRNCQGCPLRNKCHKGKENREIRVNHKLRRYKQLAREKLTSPKGLEHRSKRPVEAVFGQIKWNKGYKRFRHKGLDKIVMDFGILAIAFNIGKMISKQKKAQKGRNGRDYKTDKGRKWSL